MLTQMWQGLMQFTQRVNIFFVYKDEISAAVFSISMGHHSKARKKNLGFTSVG